MVFVRFTSAALANGPARRGPRLTACYGYTLVTEPRNEFQRTSDRLDIPAKCGDLTVFEIRSRLEARNVRLIHLGLMGDIDLRFARSLTQTAQRQANPPRRAKATAQDADGFHFGLRSFSSNVRHGFAPSAALASSHSKSPSMIVATAFSYYGLQPI
jgi:hypothetical protein